MFENCFYWVTPPLTDPLYLFPLSPRWTGLTDVTEDFQELYASSGLSAPTGNGTVLIVVFGLTMDNISPTTNDIDMVSKSLSLSLSHTVSNFIGSVISILSDISLFIWFDECGLFQHSSFFQLSLTLITVTNEAGESPLLPNNGPDISVEYPEYSSSKYVTHIALSSIPLFEPPPCDVYASF